MLASSASAVTLIAKRMNNHAGPSGYDRLAGFLDARVIYPVTQWTVPRRAIGRVLRPLIRGSGSVWYQREALYSELLAAKAWISQSNQIFHFLYGENCFRYLGWLRQIRKGNFIITTYHTPPEKFLRVVRDHEHLKYLDAIVTVSSIQSRFFAELVGAEKVFFVPHGIDIHYYTPGERAQDHDDIVRLIFVGTHLRDFKTLAATARILNRWAEPFQLNVITLQKYHSLFQGIDNVRVHSGISDEDLLKLYQVSDICVMPLLDCTANNSLLEALACGLPVICTDLTGARDYLDQSCCLFTPKGNAEALAEAIRYLRKEEELRHLMSDASRNLAGTYSWEKIAAQTQAVYEKILRAEIFNKN